MDKGCKIEGCARPHYGRGWCANHWHRWRSHGDPLGGRTAWKEPERFLTEVAFVYEGDECLTWPYVRNDSGYGKIRRGKRSLRVNRLICEHRHGPAPSGRHEAAHSCGKGHLGCCAQTHLDWKTPKANAADKRAHGTNGAGERNAAAKLTLAQVEAIRALKGKEPKRVTAARFGVSRENVGVIQRELTWIPPTTETPATDLACVSV